MGRELRRVVANWEHPKKDCGSYQPMFDSSYVEELAKWIENHNLWLSGKHPDQKEYDEAKECKRYAEWAGNAPDYEYYRPEWKKEEMTWYQMYETVSEGTPVSPAFENPDDLVKYLMENGDFWDQSRRKSGDSFMPCAPWSEAAAKNMVFGSGWAPSGVICNGEYKSGVEAFGDIKNTKGEVK